MEAGGLSGGLQVRPGVGRCEFFLSTSAKFSEPVVSTGQQDRKRAYLWEDCILLELLCTSKVQMERERDVQEDTERREVQILKETTAYGMIHQAPISRFHLPPRNSQLI